MTFQPFAKHWLLLASRRSVSPDRVQRTGSFNSVFQLRFTLTNGPVCTWVHFSATGKNPTGKTQLNEASMKTSIMSRIAFSHRMSTHFNTSRTVGGSPLTPLDTKWWDIFGENVHRVHPLSEVKETWNNIHSVASWTVYVVFPFITPLYKYCMCWQREGERDRKGVLKGFWPVVRIFLEKRPLGCSSFSLYIRGSCQSTLLRPHQAPHTCWAPARETCRRFKIRSECFPNTYWYILPGMSVFWCLQV